MADFNIRSDSVDVEQIMHNIRARIREKRGVDYTEQQIHEMAKARLERFLDPQGVRSDLLQQFHRARDEAPLENFAFEDTTIFESDKPVVRFFRKLFRPVLKLFFNPNPIANALHIQAHLNQRVIQWDALYYEVMHNLVLETTRLGIEVKNMRMKVESVGSRLDFAERRARAVEGIVQYRAITGLDVPPVPAVPKDSALAESAAESVAPAEPAATADGVRRRRRRRRGRRGGTRSSPGPAGAAPAEQNGATDEAGGAGLPDGPDEGFDAPDLDSSDQ